MIRNSLDRHGLQLYSQLSTVCRAVLQLFISGVLRDVCSLTQQRLNCFGSRANLQKIAATDHSLLIDGSVIHSVDSVCDLGVILDSELTLQRHINKVASVYFHHIRRLKQICRLLGPDVATFLVSAFVLSRLGYCNAILAGLPKSTIAPLQRAQNTAARLMPSSSTSHRQATRSFTRHAARRPTSAAAASLSSTLTISALGHSMSANRRSSRCSQHSSPCYRLST